MTEHANERARHGAQHVQEFVERADASDVASHLDRLELGRNAAAGWKFDWSFNLGHLLGILTIVGGCSSTYYGIKSEIQDQTSQTARLADRVVVIERGRAENLPRLEEQIRNNGLQDQRIQNLTDALASLRQTVGDQTRTITGLADLIHDAHERQAVLEERIGHGVPHDR